VDPKSLCDLRVLCGENPVRVVAITYEKRVFTTESTEDTEAVEAPSTSLFLKAEP
jgi:hypothetical protein